ncbi:hypothetical protein SFR_2258 [Streptomyces sp. FR-008]|nr:hypothetical protein SFR_2258 [Streptomyces sp. FR-008]
MREQRAVAHLVRLGRVRLRERPGESAVVLVVVAWQRLLDAPRAARAGRHRPQLGRL